MPIRIDRRSTILAVVAAAMFMLPACSTPAPAPTPTAAQVARATFTPTEAMAAEPTATQVADPTSTATEPAPSPTATEAMAAEPTATQVAEATSTSAEVQPDDMGEFEFNLVEGQNEARYLVEEQLARIGFNIAVGITKDVTGTIVIRQNGSLVPGLSRIVVDLRSLTSDSSRRDGFIQRRTLETAKFPFAELVLTEAKGLSSPLPTSGEVDFQIVGDLTVHGVTNRTTWDVEAEISGKELIGTAVTKVTITGFGMELPLVGSVLSIEDEIDLEIDFRAALAEGQG